jgi:hypothetical protein
MERLVFLGIVAEGIDIRACGQQSSDGTGTAKSCGQMESRPPVR